MKSINFLLLCFLICYSGFATEKHALIIAISEYDKETGWKSISSTNDIPLIKEVLLKQNFKDENILILQDAAATKTGIETALEKLFSKIKRGDIVMIHYSGHGQQIWDDNGDEADGLDETLVPYNAKVDTRDGYMGENHFRDDQMEAIILNFRNKLGKEGQLFILLDSCHSGSMTRGAGIVRGGAPPLVPENWQPPQQQSRDFSPSKRSGYFNNIEEASDGLAPFVMISGASAHELNYEYKNNGSLSYAFSQSMAQLRENQSYRQLFADIKSKMQMIAPRQNPVIEGDIDFALFNNEYIRQTPYFEVKRFQNLETLIISGGKLNHLFKDTSVLILPQGENDLQKAITKGKIAQAGLTESKIVLDQPILNKGKADLWVYVDQASYEEMFIHLAFDESITDKNLKRQLQDYLEENNLGKISTELHEADLIIGYAQNQYIFNTPSDDKLQYPVEQNRGTRSTESFENLKTRIFNFTRGNYLKKLDLKNPNYTFSFRFISASQPSSPEQDTNINEHLKVVPDQDEMYLEISNKSRYDLYISIVEINNQGELSAIFPNEYCPLSDQDRMVKAGETFVVKACAFGFSDPYEPLILKGFASPFPINLQTSTESKQDLSRGIVHPVEQIIQNAFVETRGSRARDNSNRLEIYSTEFIYEIVPNQ